MKARLAFPLCFRTYQVFFRSNNLYKSIKNFKESTKYCQLFILIDTVTMLFIAYAPLEVKSVIWPTENCHPTSFSETAKVRCILSISQNSPLGLQ